MLTCGVRASAPSFESGNSAGKDPVFPEENPTRKFEHPVHGNDASDLRRESTSD
jgi:hypothetical protein